MVSRVQVPDEPPERSGAFLFKSTKTIIVALLRASVAKLADALDLGSSG